VYSEIADLVGIADPDVKAGGAASNRFNVSYYTDAAHLLKEELDAVSVCVPTEHHVKVALAVIKAGVSVLVEKPLAATVADASRVVDAAKGAGVTLAVGHIERHNPAIAVVSALRSRASSPSEAGRSIRRSRTTRTSFCDSKTESTGSSR